MTRKGGPRKITKPLKVFLEEKSLTEEIMPFFEEGLPEERGFALLGSIGDEGVKVKSCLKVPESSCGRHSFDPVPESFAEEIEKRAGKTKQEMLGYLHTHPIADDVDHVVTPWGISGADYEKMMENEEPVRGVCVLPLGNLETGVFHAVVSFWGNYCPKNLPVNLGQGDRVYLHRNPDDEEVPLAERRKWSVL